MLSVDDTNRFFEAYSWHGKHNLFGYPADTFPNFEWIRSLEKRFAYIRDNVEQLNLEAPIFLIKEMIKWGGSKRRDISPKFEDYIGTYCLSERLSKVISVLDDAAASFEAAYHIPGLGRTYATKLLRFLDPNKYGALDDQIRKAMTVELEYKISQLGGKKSNNRDLYVAYIEILTSHQTQFNEKYQKSFTVAEVEMAVFQWAVTQNSNNRAN